MRVGVFDEVGYALVDGVLSAAQCDAAARAAQAVACRAGDRSLLDRGWCASIAAGLRSHPSLSSLLPAAWRAVQCTLFCKSTRDNWSVPLHQDLSIAVAQRVDDPRLRAWSSKQGVWFVQPPVEVLRQLVAVRVHLDDCTATDGALRVVPASHGLGIVDVPEQTRGEARLCTARRGAALVMRPLLLHASGRSEGDGLRRVLHFLFGPPALPLGLCWAHTI